MISPMTKYSFILLSGEQEGLLQKLQEIGLVDITRSAKPVDPESYELMGEIDLLKGIIQFVARAGEHEILPDDQTVLIT